MGARIPPPGTGLPVFHASTRFIQMLTVRASGSSAGRDVVASRDPSDNSVTLRHCRFQEVVPVRGHGRLTGITVRQLGSDRLGHVARKPSANTRLEALNERSDPACHHPTWIGGQGWAGPAAAGTGPSRSRRLSRASSLRWVRGAGGQQAVRAGRPSVTFSSRWVSRRHGRRQVSGTEPYKSCVHVGQRGGWAKNWALLRGSRFLCQGPDGGRRRGRRQTRLKRCHHILCGVTEGQMRRRGVTEQPARTRNWWATKPSSSRSAGELGQPVGGMLVSWTTPASGR